MDDFWRDLKTGLRQLAHKPTLPILAVVTLSLGIGANTAVFSIVHGILLQPLPFPEPAELVQVWEAHPRGGNMSVASLNAADWRRENRTLEHLSVFGCGRTAVTGGREPVRTTACSAGREFFDVLQVPALAGSTFPPEERDFDGTPAAVISHGFWQRQLGGTADFSEVVLEIYGRRHPVVGVMPQSFDFPTDTDVWFADNIFSRPPPESRSGQLPGDR